MENLIIDNQQLKYRVVDAKGKVLRENVVRSVAERFIDSLDEDAQSGVKMIPIAPTGDQILFG